MHSPTQAYARLLKRVSRFVCTHKLTLTLVPDWRTTPRLNALDSDAPTGDAPTGGAQKPGTGWHLRGALRGDAARNAATASASPRTRHSSPKGPCVSTEGPRETGGSRRKWLANQGYFTHRGSP